jgi:hypothetical protein
MIQFSTSIKPGIAGGTIMGILVNIHSHDVMKTVALSAIGAAVSCIVSLFIKFLLGKLKRLFKKPA